MGSHSTLCIETERNEHTAVIRIWNNEPGITAKHPEPIFQPFYSTKKEGSMENMGLDIPMSYGIIKNYDGDMAFRNLVDSGCEFTVTLPIAEQLQRLISRLIDPAPFPGAAEFLRIFDKAVGLDSQLPTSRFRMIR